MKTLGGLIILAGDRCKSRDLQDSLDDFDFPLVYEAPS